MIERKKYIKDVTVPGSLWSGCMILEIITVVIIIIIFIIVVVLIIVIVITARTFSIFALIIVSSPLRRMPARLLPTRQTPRCPPGVLLLVLFLHCCYSNTCRRPFHCSSYCTRKSHEERAYCVNVNHLSNQYRQQLSQLNTKSPWMTPYSLLKKSAEI